MSTATAFALPLPARPKAHASRFNAYLLHVTFEVVDGERRSAIGGGESIPDAIAAAHAELPDGDWALVRWNPLYGE
jgi:hypothetical protein